MNFENFAPYFLLGMAGAASVEVLKAYEYKGKLSQKKYQVLIKSFTFWSVVIGMLCASGFIAWAFNSGTSNANPWTIVTTGIAARSIIRQVTAAQVANSSTKLGDEISLQDIFL